jgi:hypothetical protein
VLEQAGQPLVGCVFGLDDVWTLAVCLDWTMFGRWLCVWIGRCLDVLGDGSNLVVSQAINTCQAEDQTSLDGSIRPIPSHSLASRMATFAKGVSTTNKVGLHVHPILVDPGLHVDLASPLLSCTQASGAAAGVKAEAALPARWLRSRSDVHYSTDCRNGVSR